MTGIGNGPGPGPPPPPESTSDRLGLALIALGALIVVLLVVLILMLVTGDDGGDVAANPTITQAPPTSEQATTTTLATTTAPPTTLATTTAPAPVTTVELPSATLIYNQPINDAVILLTGAGLVVDTAGIGCSNSTTPGMVRQVTVGSQRNVMIIYGKPTDTIDEAAAGSLHPGDEVTVWTPSSNPCP